MRIRLSAIVTTSSLKRPIPSPGTMEAMAGTMGPARVDPGNSAYPRRCDLFPLLRSFPAT